MSYLCSGDQLPTVKEVVAPLAINPNPVVGPALAASGLAVQAGRSGGTHPRVPRTTGGARSMIWLTWRQHRVQALGCQSATYAFMALRLPVEYWLRQRYQTQVIRLFPSGRPLEQRPDGRT